MKSNPHSHKQDFVRNLLQSKQQRLENPTPEDTLFRLFNVSDFHTLTMDVFGVNENKELIEVTGFTAWKEAALRHNEYAFEAARLTPQGNEIQSIRQDGQTKTMLNFSGYNYLGYSHHPLVIEAAKVAIDRYGIGSGSSPVSSGTTKLHNDFANDLVDFFGVPNWGAALFSSGYSVNVGALCSVLSPGHYAILDQNTHMSIVEGAQISGAHILYFEHNNMAHLEQQLKKVADKNKRIIVCSEGVFSADGDFGKIAKVVELAKKYGALTLVDEAHSILLTGKYGRGVCDEQGVLSEIDFLVLTFSKGFGGVGGALIANKEITDYVNWYSRCRMFSCALDPGVTGGMQKALEMSQGSDGDQRRRTLHNNAKRLKTLLSPIFNLGETNSWVIPVIYGSDKITLPLYSYLQDIGLEGSTMQYPAVPKEKARIRLFVTANHTDKNLQDARDILLQAAQKFNLKNFTYTPGSAD